jgi:hypothetical protein
MKVSLIAPLLLASISLAAAQNFSPKKPEHASDRKAQPRKDSVTVDISDSAIADDFEAKDFPAPPEAVEGNVKKAEAPAAGPETETLAPAGAEPEGVIVRIEPGKSGAAVDSSKIKLLAPFPAKALAKAPAGWRLEHPEDVPPLVKEVTLDNGTHLNLSIRPHVLVPDSDGHQVIAVGEPGYESALQYDQTKTMGAILSSSLDHMDKDSKDLGDALERLQQLLGSLPHPAPAAKLVSPQR